MLTIVPTQTLVSTVMCDPPLPDFEIIAAFMGQQPESATARAFLAMLTREMIGREVTEAH
jgi:hypothetical protein